MDPRMSRQTRRRLHRENSTVDNNHYTFLLNKKERLKLEELGIVRKIKEDEKNETDIED